MSTTTVGPDGEVRRRCWRCLAWKPLASFYRNRRDKHHGHDWQCSACALSTSLTYRAENLDDVRERDRLRARERRAGEIRDFISQTIDKRTSP